MARRFYSSIAVRTTLSSGIDDTVTSITVAAVTGFPASYPYTLIIDEDIATQEVVEVTAGAGTTLTITRGVDGSVAAAHSSGAAVNHGVSARDFDEPNLHVNTDVKHVLVVTSGTRPGSPADGQIIFETDTDSYFGWSGTEWASIGGGGDVSIVTYEYTATASQTVFTGADDNALSMSFTSGLIQVFLNGVLLNPGDDYTTSVNTVTLASGATVGDSLTVVAFASFEVANTYTQTQSNAIFATKVQLDSAGFNPFLLMGA